MTWDVALNGEQRDFIGVRPCREFLAFTEPELPCCSLLWWDYGVKAQLPHWSRLWRSCRPRLMAPAPKTSLFSTWFTLTYLTSWHSPLLHFYHYRFLKCKAKKQWFNPSHAWNCFTCLKSLSWEKSCGSQEIMCFTFPVTAANSGFFVLNITGNV